MPILLVIDDEKDVCDFSKVYFEGHNIKVFCATSGEEGLNILNNQKPDIILLDIRMKGMNGIEVLKRIKETNNKADVIMVTALDDMNLMEDAKKFGASDYVTKPLVLEELEKKIMDRIAKVKS